MVRPRITVGIYRSFRPLVVDAIQCKEAKTITTDLGFINVKQGEWVISGEGGETYIVDDAFFQRTFVPVQENQQWRQRLHAEHEISTEPALVPVSYSRPSSNRDRIRLKSRLAGRRKIRIRH